MVDARFPGFLVQRTGPRFPVEYIEITSFPLHRGNDWRNSKLDVDNFLEFPPNFLR